jgi:transposase
LRLAISGGNVHDSQMMHAFLDWDKPPLAIVADKAYGNSKITRQVADEGAMCVVPAKSNARKPVPHDANLCAMRNIVERFFCEMKDMRKLSTRFEKYTQNFLAMLHLFAIKCWINWIHTLIKELAICSVISKYKKRNF